MYFAPARTQRSVLVLVLEMTEMNEPIFDHEQLDVYRLSIDYVAFSFEHEHEHEKIPEQSDAYGFSVMSGVFKKLIPRTG